MDADQRGTSDTSYATVERAQWCNRAAGVREDPLRGEHPVTKELPKPVELASNRATAVHVVYRVDTQACGPGGARPGLLDVKAGDPVYDKDGKQVKDFHELRDTYEVYHCSDLNAAGVTARTLPNVSARAIKQQNEAFAEQCKANGVAVREPDAGERIGVLLAGEQDKLKRDLREISGVDIQEHVAGVQEAQFVVTDGQPTIQMPKAEAFEDVHHQASSLVHAASDAHLYKAAVGRAGRAAEGGHVDVAAEARVVAYELPLAQRAKSDEFLRADLAATHATVNRTTAMPEIGRASCRERV